MTPYLEQLGFDLVGYGCTTCIGNSGPLPDEVVGDHRGQQPRRRLGAQRQPQLRRPHPAARARELPRVAAARRRLRARRHDDDRPHDRAARHGSQPARRCILRGHLADASARSRTSMLARGRQPTCSREKYADVFKGDDRWRALPAPEGERFAWDDDSTYIRKPPFFDDMTADAGAARPTSSSARVLAVLGDSVTTDHISPAGSIKKDSPAGQVPDRARRRAGRLQLVRRAPRQSRGDGARHLREHPAAQPARAGHRRRRHAAPARTASR